MERHPIVDGQFYPGTPTELESEIGRLINKGATRDQVIGIVSPHAGYRYSGPVAGATFSRVKIPNTVVLLGPNHTGKGARFSIMTEGTWQTPLGRVDIDSSLATTILNRCSHLEEDIAAHAYEHSIEVQLPFLQYFRPNVRIVPIILSQANRQIYREIGQSIADAIGETSQNVLMVASSDMTHYEPQAIAESKDLQAIGAILDLNENDLLQRIDQLNITMCGYAPTVTLIAAAKKLGATGAQLIRYQTSGDITGDHQSVVGYAGIIIY